jgi:hypothetical protein
MKRGFLDTLHTFLFKSYEFIPYFGLLVALWIGQTSGRIFEGRIIEDVLYRFYTFQLQKQIKNHITNENKKYAAH